MSNEICTSALETVLSARTVAATWTRLPVRALQAANVDPGPLLRNAGLNLDMLKAGRTRVPAQSDAIVWIGAAKLSGVPSFGTATLEHHATDEMLGLPASHAIGGTVADVLRASLRLHPFAESESMFRFAENAFGGVWIAMPGSREPAWPVVTAEAALAFALELARRATGRRLDPSEVWFQHPRPPNDDACERYFGAPLRFGQFDNRLVFAPDVLRVPLLAPRELADDRTSLEVVDRSDDGGRFSERVRAAIRASFGVEQPRVRSAAAALGMSARTVQRRLAQENVSFQDVLDGVRSVEAKRMLASGAHDAGSVARHLGFASAASFRHAFKRWTGISLRAHRRSVAAPAE